MKFTKILLSPKEKTLDELTEVEIEAMEYFLWSLYHNSQIFDGWDVIKTDNVLSVFVTQVDADSLDEKYDGEYVRENKEKIKQYFQIKYETVGTPLYAEKTCPCADSDFYVLYTADFHFGSPVICGNCGNSVPLYKLPHSRSKSQNAGTNKDYSFELGWERAWKNVEALWYEGLADRWTERQIIDPKSALSKWGREYICKEFEEVTQKKFYYFLFDADFNDKRDLQSKCPECGKEWQKKKINEEYWSFCDDCRLATKQHWQN